MESQKPIIIKIGTNVLTTEEGVLDHEVIKNIVDQIVELYRQDRDIIIVSSGAAACGRKRVCFMDTKDPIIEKQMLTAIGQARLMRVYGEYFRQHGIIVAQALLERTNFWSRKRYNNLRHTLDGLVKHKIIPIVNENDVVATRGLRFGDNDELASLLAVALQAEKLIICSDVDGLYTNDPRLDESAELIKEVGSVTEEVQKMAKGSSSGVGLGGMLSKLQVAKLATHWGVETWIVKGKRKNCILDIYAGKGYGTRFIAEPNPAKDAHRWMSSAALSSGMIKVDEGAAKAIQERKSLLAVGIEDIRGEFSKDDIVNINFDKRRIAVGIVKCSSTDIEKLLELSKEEKRGKKEIIHADDIVLMS